MAEVTRVLDLPIRVVTDSVGDNTRMIDTHGNNVMGSVVRRDVFSLVAEPVTFYDDPGVAQYGSITLKEFPAGNIITLGATIDATLTLNEAWWVNDTPGDVGLGTVAGADGSTLSTTRQNIIPTTEVAALTAQVGPIDAQSTGLGVSGAAGGTDALCVLNLLIDDSASHMPDVITNGAFGSDANWVKGTGWTIGSGVADCDGSQTAVSLLTQTGAVFVPGVSYSVIFTATRSAGTVYVSINGTAGTVRSTAATFTQTIVAGASGGIKFTADADFVGTIDDVIATPLTGSGTVTGTVTVVWTNAGDIA